MQELKENDLVYTDFGYGTIVKSSSDSSQIDGVQEQKAPEGAEVPRPSSREEHKENTITDNKTVETNNGKLVRVKLHWGGEVFLEDKNITKKIKLHIKTFYGPRKKINLDVDITTTIQQLKNILLEHHLDNAKILYNLRLIYAMGTLQELTHANHTIEQYRISHDANLILLVQTSFMWDPNMRASGIKLQHSNLTAGKLPEVDYQTVLGTLVLSSGRHYWEIKVDQFNDEEDLFIGIARKDTNLYARPIDTNTFWGYMCLCAKKFGPDGVLHDYGYQAKKGDVIGVLLEYKSGLATLSFYRNTAKCGIAFSNLTGTFYPAVCMNYGDVQVTLDPKAPMPLS